MPVFDKILIHCFKKRRGLFMLLEVGRTVQHKKYGKGEITKIIADNHYVKFENLKRVVVFPADSFTEEYFILSEDEKKDQKNA